VKRLLYVCLDGLGDDPEDFFLELNTNALVIEVPDDALGDEIGVWGVTQYLSGGMWLAGDQMGRPAINTVFNNPIVDTMAGQTKNRFNATAPSDRAA